MGKLGVLIANTFICEHPQVWTLMSNNNHSRDTLMGLPIIITSINDVRRAKIYTIFPCSRHLLVDYPEDILLTDVLYSLILVRSYWLENVKITSGDHLVMHSDHL